MGAMIAVRNALRYGQTLRHVMDNLGSTAEQGDFKLLVGGGPVGEPQLYIYDSQGCRDVYEDRKPEVIGGIPPSAKRSVEGIVL